MKLAIVGATGLVGNTMLEVLEEFGIEYSELILVASERSVGKQIRFGNKNHTVCSNEQALTKYPDIAIFSAGASTSKIWAPKYAAQNCFVIDNSSAWRMEKNIPLVVPEINGNILTRDAKIIANPNCSTIQMVLGLSRIHRAFGIKRLVISTYQSFTGTGVVAVNQYNREKEGLEVENPAYPYPIFENCLPHCDIFLDNGYTKEEMKLVHETRKILGDEKIKITATAVRVPVDGGHSESINVECKESFEMDEIRELIINTPGVKLLDDINNNVYPMPLMCKNKNEVFVGRLRRDESSVNTFNVWIVSDNLRKGAATNAVQIASYLQSNEILAQ